jgi:hypothetical protein
MTTPNEGKTCDAILRLLEEREGAPRHDLVVDTAASRGVEAVCAIGMHRYAVEHTSIDSYPDKRLDDQQFMAAMGPLESELSHEGLLRSDCYYCATVPIRAFARMKARELPAVRDALRAWIVEAAHKFQHEYPGQNLWMAAKPPSVPVPIGLDCMLWPALGDTLKIARYAPENLEALRRQRLRKAILKKGPKLQAERAGGAVAVLVLEDFDSAMANPIVIGNAVRDELEDASFDIDEAYLVCTHFQESWTVFQLKQGAIYWPSAIHIQPKWRDFQPDQLCDIIATSNPL